MRMRMKVGWVLALASFGTACGSDHEGRATGTPGAPCYPNDTCNRGLACEQAVCVEAPDGSSEEAGGAGPGAGGAPSSGGPAGADGQRQMGGRGAGDAGGASMPDSSHDAAVADASVVTGAGGSDGGHAGSNGGTSGAAGTANNGGTHAGGAGGVAGYAGAAGGVGVNSGGAGGVAGHAGATNDGGANNGGVGGVSGTAGSNSMGGSAGTAGSNGGGGQGGAGGSAGASGAGGTMASDGPHVQFIAPYIGIANHAGTFIARGQRFNENGSAIKVNIGATVVGPIVTDSDTQVTVNYPALPAGRYPVSIQGGDGDAELVVVESAVLPYHEVDAPSTRSRILYDAERKTLYAVNSVDQEIERYQLSGTTWTTLTPYILPHPTDIALSPNGRLLVILTESGVSDVDLNQTPFVAVTRAENSDTFCSKAFSTFAMLNDGKFIITTFLAACSGFSETQIYDVTAHTLDSGQYPTAYAYSGIVGGSLDGSRIYGGSNGVSPAQNIMIWNALDDSVTTGNPSYNLSAVTVSGNASRVILQQTDVFSRSLTPTGYLPPDGISYASHDSTRAFVYRDDNAMPRLVAYDLTAALDTGATYPVAKTVNLATSPVSASGTHYVAMTSTPDDAVVFVSGDSKIAIVPVK